MAATAEGNTSTRPHCRAWPRAVRVLEAMESPWYNSIALSGTVRPWAFLVCQSQIGRWLMAKRCAICGKEPQYGHHVSHAKNRVNRRFMPNLQMGRVTVGGRVMRARVCTRCLRTYTAA